MNAQDLSARYAQLKEANSTIRTRDAAAQLGVSELELVCLDPATVRLDAKPADFLRRLPAMGRMMALTRNEVAVHERKGVWPEPKLHGPHVGLLVSPDIDLRLFLNHWVHLLATTVANARGPLRSLQVFDASGTAVQKIYATPDTDLAAWDALVEAFRTEEAPAGVVPATSSEPGQPDAAIDADALRTAWAEMRDTHDAFGLLRRMKVGRQQALRLLGPPWARPVDPAGSLRDVLDGAAADGSSIMVFVGNRGCIQIHTGPIRTVMPRGDWMNVMDPDFNLHVNVPGLAAGWVVRKPTDDGYVHSLELFDAEGELVVQLFGARKPGQADDPVWTARAMGLA